MRARAYAVGEGKGRRNGKVVCEARIIYTHHAVSEPGIPYRAVRMGGAHRGADKGTHEVSGRREVWITGVGLLTCLGEGLEATWQHLERGDPPPYDDKSFAPYIVHPLAPVNFDKQIPKKSDQRQMEPWQRIGVYAAGLSAERRRYRRQTRTARHHRHDRRRRRRRARYRRRLDDPHRHAQGDRARRIPQRAADERPAADFVPGAAPEPPRRQHLNRAWRRRLLAHVSGRGSSRRRCGAHRTRAHRLRTERT